MIQNHFMMDRIGCMMNHKKVAVEKVGRQRSLMIFIFPIILLK